MKQKPYKEVILRIDEDVLQDIQKGLQAKMICDVFEGITEESVLVYIVKAIYKNMKNVHISFKKKRSRK